MKNETIDVEGLESQFEPIDVSSAMSVGKRGLDCVSGQMENVRLICCEIHAG